MLKNAPVIMLQLLLHNLQLVYCIECFFQQQSHRDHFCALFIAPHIPFSTVTNYSQNASTLIYAENLYDPKVNFLPSKNQFMNAQTLPPCDEIMAGRQNNNRHNGLVNYKCTVGGIHLSADGTTTHGIKCCSFGEKYQVH